MTFSDTPTVTRKWTHCRGSVDQFRRVVGRCTDRVLVALPPSPVGIWRRFDEIEVSFSRRPKMRHETVRRPIKDYAAYVQPRNRKISNKIGIGIPRSQSKIYPVAAASLILSFRRMWCALLKEIARVSVLGWYFHRRSSDSVSRVKPEHAGKPRQSIGCSALLGVLFLALVVAIISARLSFRLYVNSTYSVFSRDLLRLSFGRPGPICSQSPMRGVPLLCC